MGQTCTVDAELFDSLDEAIAFVLARGGGTVYTDLADSLSLAALKLPPTVRLETSRPEAA